MNSHAKGVLGEERVIIAATERGYIVSRPILDARYDLLLDNGEEIYRVQAKYVSTAPTDTQGSFEVPLSAQCRNNDYERSYGEAEIDAVIVFLSEIEVMCWLPIDIVAERNTINLRYKPARNGQRHGINSVDDYRW